MADAFTWEVEQSFEFTYMYICNNSFTINRIYYPFVLAASVAEGDQEEQLEAPTKKQKISKKVQTRVSPQIKRYVQGSPNSSQSPNIFRLKKNQKDISKKVQTWGSHLISSKRYLKKSPNFIKSRNISRLK